MSEPTLMLSTAHSSVPRRILKKPFSPQPVPVIRQRRKEATTRKKVHKLKL